MMRPMLSVLAALTLLLPGCGGEAPVPATHDTTVYVGTAEGLDPSVHFLVALTIDDGILDFVACGDEATDTTTTWGQVADVDTSMAENPVSAEGTGSWQLNAVISDDLVRGSISKGGIGDFQWDAWLVPSDHPSGPGIYSDGGGCETWVIVAESGSIQGSYCTAQGGRAQVDPLYPVDEGWLVQLQPGTEVIVRRVLAK